MSVIIRLQNLPWSANALDIRQYFHGLNIPEGGVHIVGGELGDAFIAFSTDEDARQAFNRNNGKIKEVQINLMLSSRTEMQRVIQQARTQSYAAFIQNPTPTAVPMPAAVPTIIPTAPELRKESKDRDKSEKRDSRRKSRSKSRERRDRSRDRREKRHRRSRSRSRERKSRRRERSRSRGRSRSKERKSSKDHRKRIDEPIINPFQREIKKTVPEIWAKQRSIDVVPPKPQQPLNILGNFPIAQNQANRSLDHFNVGSHLHGNGGSSSPFTSNNSNRNSRDSWPPSNNESNFQNNRNTNFRDREIPDKFQNNRFQSNIPNRGANNPQEIENCSIALEPFYGGYGDVRRFFHGKFISGNGIKFINDLSGRATGVVYVRFSNRKFKEDALRNDGELLNGIRVTISHINDDEFEEATDRYNPRNNDSDMHDDNSSFKSRNITKYFNHSSHSSDLKPFSCLTVDDLPTYCKEQDILHMFSQHPLVALILTNKKRGGFIAYVKFSSSDVAKQALDEKAHHIVGGKQVTVRPCKDDEFDDINKMHEVNLNTTKEETLETDCLSVSELPEKTNDKDIADFFSDIGVIPIKIHLMSNNLGFTGQAYCEFANYEEATRAARKNETSLGNVVISVLPIKRGEMETILGTTLPAPEPTNPQDSLIKENEPTTFTRPSSGASSNLPAFNMQNNSRPVFPSRNFDNMRGGPRFGPRGFGGGPPRSRFGPPKDVFEDVPPGCTIFMKNVPYKANTNDILNFFDGFNHTNNVSRRYNPNNTPSDEAKIIFFEPDEASRAVEELQKEKIWDRQIFLRQE